MTEYYCCDKCGNIGEFECHVTQRIEQRGIKYFHNGTDEDTELDFTDSEADTDPDEDHLECSECGRGYVETFDSDKERDVFIYEHTKKDGTWSEDWLKNDERNEELRAKQVAKNL